MSKSYLICVDGIDGYEEWSCEIDEENNGVCMTEGEMLNDVWGCLEELGGGHADIFDEETDELFADIEV